MNNPTYQQALHLYKNGDKRQAFGVIQQAPFEDIMRFITGKDRYKHRAFWKSTLPERHCKALFESLFAPELWLTCFTCLEPVPIQLLQQLADKFPGSFEHYARICQVYLKPKRWKQLSFLQQHPNQQLRTFHLSAIWLMHQNELSQKAFEPHVPFIEQLTVEEILVYMQSTYERYKRSDAVLGKKGDQIAHEVNWATILVKMLQLKMQHASTNNTSLTPDLNPGSFKKFLDKHAPQTGRNYFLSDAEKLFDDLLSQFWERHVFERQLDLYASGLTQVCFSNGNPFIEFTDPHLLYRRNDRKNHFYEYLFISKAKEKSFPQGVPDPKTYLSRHIEVSIAKCILYFQYLHTPLKIDYKGNEVDMQKVFTLLVTFARSIMPDGKDIINGKVYNVRNMHLEKPRAKFGESRLQVWKYDSLLSLIKTYFKWDLDEVRHLLSFLTTDLNASDEEITKWFERPFLKMGDLIYYFSTFLKDRAWAPILQGRIFREMLAVEDQQKLTTEMESGLAKAFSEAGIPAIPSYEYSQEGEIDTLAYHDGHLFVIEMKATHNDEDLLRLTKYWSRKLACKATLQLQRSVDFIKENFASIQAIDTLKIDKPLEEIKIVPLVVSNLFEWDDFGLHEGQLKLSLFELMVILRNDLYDMLNIRMFMELPVWAHESFTSALSPLHKGKRIDTSKEACNLWSGNTCSGKDLYNAIMKDKVWSFIDELYAPGHGF